ncbi:MAG: hypothetical protein M3Z75_06195 [Actinomycetota bacterium]|nr:hypothetical protein [Actinomycetota bacterium]
MPQNKDLKRLVRARMAESGENYTQALTHVLGRVDLEPLPAPWQITGSPARDYEMGLLTGISYEGNRVAQLRFRSAISEPVGFGAVMQSITATRYRGGRVRFSSLARACEVSDWAGLWLRVDGLNGTLIIDNMQDRPLRGSTDWTEASIVLDVPEKATTLHFGALLSGAGAIDLARPRFEDVGEAVPVTVTATVVPLLDEPQALDFSAPR